MFKLYSASEVVRSASCPSFFGRPVRDWPSRASCRSRTLPASGESVNPESCLKAKPNTALGGNGSPLGVSKSKSRDSEKLCGLPALRSSTARRTWFGRTRRSCSYGRRSSERRDAAGPPPTAHRTGNLKAGTAVRAVARASLVYRADEAVEALFFRAGKRRAGREPPLLNR